MRAARLRGLALPERGHYRPERAHYRDRGCDLHPSCLVCPLSACRYDKPRGTRSARNAEIRAMRRADASITAIGQRYGLSRRDVFQVLSESGLPG